MLLPPLTEGRLVVRRNRFVAEVEVAGQVVEAHCPNTGSMLNCMSSGGRVRVIPSEDVPCSLTNN